jgi:hypothetical protein
VGDVVRAVDIVAEDSEWISLGVVLHLVDGSIGVFVEGVCVGCVVCVLF